MKACDLSGRLTGIIDRKTKPLGALGKLEEIAWQVGMIQQTTSISIKDPHIVVFAADHGIAKTGLVSPFPQEVTAQMVLNFLAGGGAINVFCRQHGIALNVVDAGVNYDFGLVSHKMLMHNKIERGTGNYFVSRAMSEEQAWLCIDTGKRIVSEIKTKTGCNCIGFGEMGIGNTSSASLIMSTVLGIPIQECVGAGTGVNEEQLKIKKQTLEDVFSLHQLHDIRRSPIQVLSRVGGFEIAMITGAYLQAYANDMIIVVDGFIATAALLLALGLQPLLQTNCIFAHKSDEKGHALMLHQLKANPLLDLGLRLGEGTGAALAIPLIRAAVNFFNEMASFETAAVSNRSS